jgi:hypothetical protein
LRSFALIAKSIGTFTSTRKSFSCMRMKLCFDHMRWKVWLYVLHRTEEQMSKHGQ